MPANTIVAPSGPGLHSITATFVSQSVAEAAIEELVARGIARDRIRLLPGYERDVPDTEGGGSAPDPGRPAGFLGVVATAFDSDEDLRRGAAGRSGVLVTVEAGPAERDTVAEVLGRDGVVDSDNAEPA
jgi:hypothetical protein